MNWKKKDTFLEICNNDIDAFKMSLIDHKFQTSGIFYAEAYAFLCMCKLYNIDLIVESGMSRGNSTEIFLKNFKGNIITCEHRHEAEHDEVVKRLSTYENFKGVYFEKSQTALKKIIEENPNKNIALFIDGPKNLEAANLVRHYFNYSNVAFAGIHDVANPITKKRPDYGFMSNFGHQHILSTDETHHRDLYGYLDETISDSNGAWIYNDSGISQHSNDPYAILKRFPKGPGIGIAINTYE